MGSYDWHSGRAFAPNAEQNLLVSPCKHLYFTNGQEVKYQQKVIDPLRAGNKHLLTRLLVLDTNTRAFYGELHPTDDVDVLGFLARAWVQKPDHFMHGFPTVLNLPRAVLDNERHMDDIRFLRQLLGFHLDQLPSGFKAGARQLGMFEQEISYSAGRKGRQLLLWAVQAISALVSFKTSLSNAWESRGAWGKVEPLPAPFWDAVDNQYTNNGWREEQWKSVVEGSASQAADS